MKRILSVVALILAGHVFAESPVPLQPLDMPPAPFVKGAET